MAVTKPIPVEVFQQLDLADLFARGIRKGECLEWSGSRFTNGYGRLKINGRSYKVHRLAWALIHGDTKSLVLHRCDNPPCFRSDHLFDGDNAANVADMDAKGRRIPGFKRYVGEESPMAKLSEVDVKAIHAAVASGESNGSIARRYGLVKTSVANIRNGVTWPHLKPRS